MAITQIILGMRGKFTTHRRLGRWVWPIWMYVSVTGVAIYLLLYHLNPSPG
jgi:putative membrane protein